MNIPQKFDVYEMNSSQLGVVLDVSDYSVDMICKNKLTGKIHLNKIMLLDCDNLEEKFAVFNKSYKYLGKSKIVDMFFEIM